jgi:hypothetical protein
MSLACARYRTRPRVTFAFIGIDGEGFAHQQECALAVSFGRSWRRRVTLPGDPHQHRLRHQLDAELRSHAVANEASKGYQLVGRGSVMSD